MITKENLAEHAKMKGLSLGNAEKDYLLELALLILSRETKDELVFKGGTALYKFHNLDRFSEDLDFTCTKELDLEVVTDAIIRTYKRFGINASILEHNTFDNSDTVIIRTEGPLYTGNPLSYSKVEIDINFQASVVKTPSTERKISNYQEIPSFMLLVMDLDEIFAEKVRAVMTRDRPRDVYDIWFLLDRGINVDRGLLDDKLSYYQLTFSTEAFIKSLDRKKDTWEKDLKPLIVNVPEYSKVRNKIQQFFVNADL